VRAESPHHGEGVVVETVRDLPLQMTGKRPLPWRQERFCFKRKAISASMDSEASQCAPWAISSIGAI